MPLFMCQFSYTADAWAALVAHPANRTDVVRGLVEQADGRLIGLYYCFGEYDGMILVEAPDEHAVAAIAVAAIAPGHIKAIKTTTLLSPESIVDVLQRAAQLSFRGPNSGPARSSATAG